MAASSKIMASIEKSSWIRKMFEQGNEMKEKFGAENVFDFSLGNPNLEPPFQLSQRLETLAKDTTPGRHGYMENAGYAETRQAVADHLNTFNRTRFSPDDIIMTVGAGGGLNVVFKTLLNPGNEVIIPSPYFAEYNFYLDNHQGVPKVVPTNEDFSIDIDRIADAVSENTKAVLINSPNNPTGKVYDEASLKELADCLIHYSRKNGETLYLISDEPYRKIVYDGIEVPSIFDIYNETIAVTSFSKDLSIPGERVGYIAFNPEVSDRPELLSGLVFCNRILGYVNAPAFMQRAITPLLNESVDISLYEKKRDALCEGMTASGYEFLKPQGAFYLFPKTPIADDVDFTARLLEEKILAVPGTGFGGPGHMRIAYCVADEVIERALPGFDRAIKKL